MRENVVSMKPPTDQSDERKVKTWWIPLNENGTNFQPVVLKEEYEAKCGEVGLLNLDVDYLQKKLASKEYQKFENKTLALSKEFAEQTASLRLEVERLRAALEFYARNEGLMINHNANVFRSIDSDDKDFHGARARQALNPDAEGE